MLPSTATTRTLSNFVKGAARVARDPKSETLAFCTTAQMTDAANAKDLFDAIREGERLEDESIAKLSGGRAEKPVRGLLRPGSPMAHQRTIRFLGVGRKLVPEFTALFAAGPYVVECALVGRKVHDEHLEGLITRLRGDLANAPAAAESSAR